MVVHGVSTRKVTEITEALCGVSFSKSTVSALCAHLDPRVRAFNERRLTASSPFVWVDALGIAVREDDRVVSKAALIATGIRDDGVREILGLEIGDSESFAAGEDFFKGLNGRGLKGVLWVISERATGVSSKRPASRSRGSRDSTAEFPLLVTSGDTPRAAIGRRGPRTPSGSFRLPISRRLADTWPPSSRALRRSPPRSSPVSRKASRTP
jgi:hypothetical protein